MHANEVPSKDGEKYVVVKVEKDATTSTQASSDAGKDEDIKCPEILYKVQYKDVGGEIKGTKELAAPYKLKKTTYRDSEIPILEVLYSVTIWFPTIYGKKKGKKDKDDDNVVSSEMKDENDFDERSMEEKELIIHSPHIMKALRSIVEYYPGQSLLGDTISIKEPYGILVHYRKELQEYKENCDDAEASHHISVLQKYLEDNFEEKLKLEDDRHARANPVVTFEMLWMLFKPGMDVYAQFDEQRAGFVLQGCENSTENTRPGQPSPLKVKMWYLDFDGRFVGRRSHEVTIAPFEGEREITSLKVIPAHYIDNNPALSPRKQLEDRGEKFYSMLMGKQMDYRGFSMPVEQKPKRFHEGRVVVDQSAFYTYADWQETQKHPAPVLGIDDDDSGILADLHYNCNCTDCNSKRLAASANTRWGRYENIEPRETPSLAETDANGIVSRHKYFLCPRRIMGFDLKSKKWQALDVDCCQSPKFYTSAIENLVLPNEKQEMIKALVHKYTSSKKAGRSETTWSADPIPNKGEGQIFLLHGPPGAGKTYTAECVAEFTSRPLLSLTCGDIGTDEFRVEESLSKWFKLAEIWGAVMLIDEADVYLERREVSELTRNGLVSVFLRAMEYYRGILFLTTNRVGHFDPAFFSRIHVYIGYRPLDSEGRKRIWLQFFTKLGLERGHEITIKSAAKRYILSDDVLKDIEWNGREIRNAFQTAVALAEYEAETKKGGNEDGKLEVELRRDHFEKVVEMSDNFKKYLATVGSEEVAGQSEMTKAKINGDRGDDALL
ncbi:CND8 [Botrytis cinerea B05.10]|uniref:CND8 n=1 Tax=Botryotinia fuckeliana (strain B05.10) TaxID=332648 RepID=A0A384K679_BOTFB|nr:CND8 [Botrytis cinerea B05.10]ATZ58271.1 CND8 [Botrytis cinerea B05.10]